MDYKKLAYMDISRRYTAAFEREKQAGFPQGLAPLKKHFREIQQYNNWVRTHRDTYGDSGWHKSIEVQMSRSNRDTACKWSDAETKVMEPCLKTPKPDGVTQQVYDDSFSHVHGTPDAAPGTIDSLPYFFPQNGVADQVHNDVARAVTDIIVNNGSFLEWFCN